MTLRRLSRWSIEADRLQITMINDDLIGSGGDSLGVATPTDALGNARPTSGRYDIGPTQYNGTVASPTIISVSLFGNSFVAGSW
jgi:hypothetical protein